MSDQSKLKSLLLEYGESHQNKTNIAIHKVCVPAITFSVVGLIYSIPLDLLSVRPIWFVLLAVVIYYGLLSLKYLMLFLPMIIIFLGLSNWLDSIGILWQSSLFIFVIAWIGQFYGHKVEGKKPSFFKDLQFLLVGPLWTIKTVLKLEN